MTLRRSLRRFVASLLALCVLFAQTAAIAYACPRNAVANADAAVPCSAHLGANQDDAPATIPEGNVCEVHCQALKLPDPGAPDVPLPVPVIAWHLPTATAAAAAVAPFSELEARSAAPPPLVLLSRLRI